MTVYPDGMSLLCGMIVLRILAPVQIDALVPTLDHLAQDRNVSELDTYLVDKPKSRSPFSVIKSGGSYDVGRFGWHALALKSPSGKPYIVFSTPLTSEDTGEILFAVEGGKLRFVPEPDDLGVKIVRHSFDLTFQVPAKKAVLSDQVQFSSKSSNPEFLFRMSPCYKVSAIKAGNGEAVPFTQAGGVVVLPRPAESTFTYKIDYAATVDLRNYAGSISEQEATLTNDYWYPMIARHPAPYDITIRSPKSWMGVGQGELVSETDEGDQRVTKYRMDLPVTFYSVSAAPYRHFSQTIDGRKFHVWSTRMTEDQMRTQTELYAPILKFYERFAKFPFSGYGAVDSAVYGGGALEAYSFATYGGGLPSLDAHEPSHTWWGGILNSTYFHSFWNESFAVYSDGIYHREVPIGNAEERRKAFIQDPDVSADFKSTSLADSGFEWGGVAGSLGYGKGAKVLQMLEVILGSEQMIGCMHEWANSNPVNHEGEWEQFEAVVLRHRPELKSFFNDWVRRPGYAEFGISKVGFANGELSFSVDFKGPRFWLPLEVLVEGKGGTRRIVRFDLSDDKSTVVRIPCPEGKPSHISIDPWRRLVREVSRDETPVEIGASLRSVKTFVDPKHEEYIKFFSHSNTQFPTDLSGAMLIGSPETELRLKPLFDSVGFKVSGNSLTWKGTTIDLRTEGAMAVANLPGGKHCVIAIGTAKMFPEFGRARVVLFDRLGRFLRGVTDPKTSGSLTFAVP